MFSIQADDEINFLFMRLPNLLDSRVRDGEEEADNEIVSEWGGEYLKSGKVRMRLVHLHNVAAEWWGPFPGGLLCDVILIIPEVTCLSTSSNECRYFHVLPWKERILQRGHSLLQPDRS